MISLFKDYLEERQDVSLISTDVGFATYKLVDNETVWLIDIFVDKDYRRKGIATQLSELVQIEAEKLGCTKMLGSVDITANGVTESMKSVLSNGFKFSHANGNILYFVKEI